VQVMSKATPAKYTQDYLEQLPQDIKRHLTSYELAGDFGKVEEWRSSLAKKYTDIDVWAVEDLILTRWRIICRYEHAAGAAFSRFLNGLKQGKILGTKCNNCGRVMIPPRVFCEWCFTDVSDWVEHSGTGIVSTYSLSHIGTDPGVRLDKPVIVAVIWFENTFRTLASSKTVLHAGGILHRLDGVEPDKVNVGLRVKPVWKPFEERVGSILDIDYFTPLEAAGK